MSKKDLFLIILVFLLGYYLRVRYLPGNILTFGYDQARDAFSAQEIIGGDFKILGPPASTPGLYHGVFYYYFLAVPYLFGKNPINAAYWVALFNAGTAFIIYYLAYLMTKNKVSGLIAAILFAISFEATQYATWLSNPTIGVWTVPLIYLGLWGWLFENKKWGPIVLGLGLGLSIQAEIFLAYHIVPVSLWMFNQRKKVKRSSLFNLALVLLLTLSSMILVEFKFGFKGLSGLSQLAVRKQMSLAYATSIGDYSVLYLNQIGRIFAFNSYPGNIGYGGALVIGIIIYFIFYSKKFRNKDLFLVGMFLATWLFSHLTVVTVGGDSTPFLMVGIGSAVAITLGIFIGKLVKEGQYVGGGLLFLILILGNLTMIGRENVKGATLFAIQKDMLLKNELDTLDWVYTESSDEKFSINTITSPLWINTTWSYLFNWYGLEEYGNLPYWHGRDQVGRQGNNLEVPPEKVSSYFLIAEPPEGIPLKFYNDEFALEEANFGTYTKRINFGEIIIEQRI